jgi:molecular chaperone GrpE
LQQLAAQVAKLEADFARRLADDKLRATLYETVQEEVKDLKARLARRDLADLVKEILGVVDLLEAGADSELAAGVRDELLEVLGRRGVELIAADGDFDPAIHRAVGKVAAAEGAVPGTVASVVRPGYMLGERVLRPAQVVVVSQAVPPGG